MVYPLFHLFFSSCQIYQIYHFSILSEWITTFSTKNYKRYITTAPSHKNFVVCIYLIKHYRHFLSTYFFVNLFDLPYLSYDIWWELVDKSSIISYFPSTFCSTLGHHQGRMYYKSDVTFVCTLLLCKNERLYCCIVWHLLFKFVSINSVSS